MNFLEDYTLLEEIGQGGYATVYKVRHNRLGYVRAIRVLNSTIAFGEEDPVYQKFLNECRLLLCLGNGNHPNIVHIYQPLLKDSKALVEMDYVDGQDIGRYLRSNSGFVPADEVVRLLTEISSALAYCHEDIYKYCMDRELDDLQDDPEDGSKLLIDESTRRRLIEKYRVIHNDIHSGNIMRRENGSFVLLDFGLAIEGDNVVRSSRRMNGAPEFMAPEKWNNDGILTPQTDIYSLGIVLYEYLTGRVPFPIDKKESNMDKAIFFVGEAHKGVIPDSIYEVRKETYEKNNPGLSYERDFPDWLEDVIMKCLEKNPSDRYASAKELYDDVIRKSSIQQDRVNSPAPAPVPVAALKTDAQREVSDHDLRLYEEISEYKKKIRRLERKVAELVLQNSSVKQDNTSLQSKPVIVKQTVVKKSRIWGWVSLILFMIALGTGYLWYSESAKNTSMNIEMEKIKSELQIANEKLGVMNKFNGRKH